MNFIDTDELNNSVVQAEVLFWRHAYQHVKKKKQGVNVSMDDVRIALRPFVTQMLYAFMKREGFLTPTARLSLFEQSLHHDQRDTADIFEVLSGISNNHPLADRLWIYTDQNHLSRTPITINAFFSSSIRLPNITITKHDFSSNQFLSFDDAPQEFVEQLVSCFLENVLVSSVKHEDVLLASATQTISFENMLQFQKDSPSPRMMNAQSLTDKKSIGYH